MDTQIKIKKTEKLERKILDLLLKNDYAPIVEMSTQILKKMYRQDYFVLTEYEKDFLKEHNVEY